MFYYRSSLEDRVMLLRNKWIAMPVLFPPACAICWAVFYLLVLRLMKLKMTQMMMKHYCFALVTLNTFCVFFFITVFCRLFSATISYWAIIIICIIPYDQNNQRMNEPLSFYSQYKPISHYVPCVFFVTVIIFHFVVRVIFSLIFDVCNEQGLFWRVFFI